MNQNCNENQVATLDLLSVPYVNRVMPFLFHLDPPNKHCVLSKLRKTAETLAVAHLKLSKVIQSE